MGIRALPTYEVKLEDVRVPLAARLGGESGCNAAQLLNYSRVALAAMAVGVARGAFEYARNYAKEREAFGRPIARFQAIRHKLADMATGTAAARALLSVENIAAVIGTSCSSAGIPAAEILSAEGILLVSSSNTAPSLTAPDTHEPFYARTAHNDSIQGAAMAQFVSEVLGATTAATIDDGSAYADQLAAVFAKSFAEDYGGTITAEEAVSVGDTDFSGVLGNIAADSPEFLYFPIFVAEGALITQQARETPGLEDTVLGGADGILSPDWLEAAGDAAEGAVLSGPDLAFSGDFYEAEFLPAYTEVSGEEAPISAFHAHAFDAYNMLADAIEAVAFEDGGTTYIPRTALRDAFFATEGYEGITGTLTCDENGDCADAKISVSEVQNGEFVRIWPEN